MYIYIYVARIYNYAGIFNIWMVRFKRCSIIMRHRDLFRHMTKRHSLLKSKTICEVLLTFMALNGGVGPVI